MVLNIQRSKWVVANRSEMNNGFEYVDFYHTQVVAVWHSQAQKLTPIMSVESAVTGAEGLV